MRADLHTGLPVEPNPRFHLARESSERALWYSCDQTAQSGCTNRDRHSQRLNDAGPIRQPNRMAHSHPIASPCDNIHCATNAVQSLTNILPCIACTSFKPPHLNTLCLKLCDLSITLEDKGDNAFRYVFRVVTTQMTHSNSSSSGQGYTLLRSTERTWGSVSR